MKTKSQSSSKEISVIRDERVSAESVLKVLLKGKVLGVITEHRRIGPPGCGKTTWIVRQAKRAVEAWCERTGGNNWECTDVLIATLTTGAAAELRSRGVRLPDEQIGTLHSHAFRALDRPKLCVGAKETRLWNEECGDRGFRLTPETGGKDTSGGAEPASGDHWRKIYQLYKSQLKPLNTWSGRVNQFAELYDQWKRINGFLDFSDLIHEAYERCESAPESPSVLIVDEAQDHDAAEFQLIRHWAKQAEILIIVGDPDQNIYSFRGADPDSFYATEIPEENTKVLSQSYRVPIAVHAESQRMIQRCQNRREVEYYPRDEPGSVRDLDYPVQGHGAVEVVRHIEGTVRSGKTAMVLATCRYMLGSVVKNLKEEGLLYWNPFSTDNNEFNPLHPSKGTSGIDRVVSYLRPNEAIHGEKARLWTPSELYSWVSICPASGLLRRGAKTSLQKMSGRLEEVVLTYEELEEIFIPEALSDLAANGISVDWLRQRINPKQGRSALLALRALKRSGYEALTSDPKIVVGTIHSVKGGEADVVYLSPEISPKEREQLLSGEEANAVYRKFYVGMTRAKESLIKLSPMRDGIEW